VREKGWIYVTFQVFLVILLFLTAPCTVSCGGTEASGSDEKSSYWAFQRPVRHCPPIVSDRAWVHSPIDGFILAALEARGLKPAQAAEKRTLIRRATFDLLGLPPHPDDVRAFLADESPDAFARVVDRLLGSPHYGQRWARHWLDVARYADSNGLDENLAYANAYRYRDYVIAAFNSDKPYDRFVIEQLAGDLLAQDEANRGEDGAGQAPDVERFSKLIATGFLALGAKMLAEDDPVKMQMDIIDEQVDTIGRTFLGLTLGCARCHDHKFDPISSADYYALAGIFKSTRTMENFTVVARWQERALASRDAVERDADLKRKIAATQADIERLEADAASAAKQPERVNQLREEKKALEASLAQIPHAMAVADDKPENLRVHVRGSHLELGPEVPRAFPRVLTHQDSAPIGPDRSGRLELARWLASADHPLTARVLANRIWHWHFGAGLVRSTDNFGKLGEQPTHPELLDWLACQFVDGGWSIKSLHRLIMLSSSYQMSSAPCETAARLDPENRLWWRMNRRRLEAEAIRDAMLAASGQLDHTMGGSLLCVANREYVTSTANVNPVVYDTRRRSIYLPVIRSAVYDVFQAFDFPDPSVQSGTRQTSTVAPQALFMMNSRLVLQQCRALAAELLSDNSLDDPARVRALYEQAYSRPPDDQEVMAALEYVERYAVASGPGVDSSAEPRRKAWQSLVRAVMSANEFLYID
jgi:hypothetical protein